jgi:hypothetical protein
MLVSTHFAKGAFSYEATPLLGVSVTGRGGPMLDRQFVTFPIFFIFFCNVQNELYRDEAGTFVWFCTCTALEALYHKGVPGYP